LYLALVLPISNAKITGTAEVARLLRQQNGVTFLLFPCAFYLLGYL